ncbi:MAG: ABC transporter ATP-binding protein [Planctomycetes bacterium]|nr:ABC transporter ATP-binding protein [Planctomycetota bacterium]
MKRLWSFFRRFLAHRRQLVAGFLCIPAAQLLDVGVTVVIGRTLDRLRSASDAEFLSGVVAIVMGLSLVRGVFRYLQRWWIVAVSRYVENELKQDLFDKLVSLPMSFHATSRSGDVVSRVTSDVENVRMFLGPGIMYSLGALVMVPVSLGLLFSIDAPLAATMIAPLVLMGLGMKVLTPRIHKWSLAVQESLAEIGHRAQENFGGIRVVKGYGREESQVARFESASRTNRENQILLGRARGVTHALTHAANDFTFVVILVVGGLAMIDRRIAAGELFQFIDLTFKVFWPIIALGWIAGMYPRALASAQRIDELLGRRSDLLDPAQPRPLEPARGALCFQEATYRYPGADRDALAALSVELSAGAVLGVVGPTGSGKSTALLLLARMMDPTRGSVRIDGVDLREARIADVRGAIGYVPQDSFLFSDTWRDNVSFGLDAPLGDEQLARLADQACLSEEVARFPAGFDQRIGERGVTLSGGQRQRTCIARALARDPRILVLDDALSAVDTETEARLVTNLRAAGRGRTVVIAAHRLSSVVAADRIVVLGPGGQVEAQGRHEELVNRPGWYRDTWIRQQARDELSVL